MIEFITRKLGISRAILKANLLRGLFLIISSSCSPGPEDEPLNQDPEIDISAILQKSVAPGQHPTLPSLTTFYQGSEVTGYSHHFYDIEGKPLLEIGFNAQKDTLGLMTFHLTDQGLLNSKAEYSFQNLTHPVTTLEYHYDNAGRLKQISRDGNNFELYEYNTAGQISKISLGSNPGLFYLFEYDEKGRISRQVYVAEDQYDTPFRDWYFGYDEGGLLISKSVPVSNTERRPMFEYRYDTKKRLVEEIEYYPEHGFALWLWKTLQYDGLDGF
ncbi:hypothetical protein [Algoriphagus terrigena]|uniref:hypothetical protein n=2 Tax=Algoriphagus terrigena TaxID=344884 RepID=UPI0004793B9D|nr:hypothetical protein [Algoriphagus terrigena]